jgi:hypothetical protein
MVTMKRMIGIKLVLLFILYPAFKGVYADTAAVLPKGVTMIQLEGRYYPTIDERYDPDGDTEDVAADFNTSLNSEVFPALSLLEAGFGLPAGSATLGDTDVSFDYGFTKTTFAIQRGITDKLTVGVIIPYWWVENDVDASVDASNATIGFNPLFGTPGDPFGSPLIPIALGGTPLEDEDVQQLLGNGVDVNGDGTIDIPGSGFKRFETWDDHGIGDIDAGLKYQYLKNDDWRLAILGALRIPTGWEDDEDNLQDYGISDEAYALRFRTINDYTGIKNLVLSLALGYDLVFSDDRTMRVTVSANDPVSAVKDDVDRDIGDTFEIEASGTYTWRPGLSTTLTYKFGTKGKDEVEGSDGERIKGLEDETDSEEHVAIVGITYSTVQRYLDKEFPVPLMASLNYRNRFAGKNNKFKSQYISLGLQVFF